MQLDFKNPAYKTAAELSQDEVTVVGRVNDKDNDGIPDKLDNFFSPNENNPETVPDAESNTFGNDEIHLVTDEQLDELKKSGIAVKVNRKAAAEDGKIPILIKADSKSKLTEILENSNAIKKKTL